MSMWSDTYCYTSQFGASCCDVPQGEAGAWIAVSRLTNTAHIHEIAMMPDGHLRRRERHDLMIGLAVHPGMVSVTDEGKLPLQLVQAPSNVLE